MAVDRGPRIRYRVQSYEIWDEVLFFGIGKPNLKVGFINIYDRYHAGFTIRKSGTENDDVISERCPGLRFFLCS